MAMLGPFAQDKGVVLTQDYASDGKFKRVGYGHYDGKRERWWLYAPAAAGALSYRAPGYARPKQFTRFRYVADWSEADWIAKINNAHRDRDDQPDGHPDSPGIPHKGSTDFAYVKGEREVLDADAAAARSEP